MLCIQLSMPKPPIACTLTSGQIKSDPDHLIPGLFKRAQSNEILPDGYRLRFAPAPGTLGAIAAMRSIVSGSAASSFDFN